MPFCRLAGNLGSLGLSAIISVGSSYLWPENFDFDITRALHAHAEPEEKPSASLDEEVKDDKAVTDPVQLTSAAASVNDETYDENKDPVKLRAAFRLAVYSSLFLFVVLILMIPLPLFFSSHVYPKAGFYVWIAVSFIWVFYGAFAVVVYPVFESRHEIGEIFSAILQDIKGQRKVAA